MTVFGLVGWSGSGKTTLLTALLPLLIAAGRSVSTVKHAHHGFDLDRPGKDSFRHRQAGAREVMIASDTRWALLHEHERGDCGLDGLIARMTPVDLVLVEGFREHPHPKIEVHRTVLDLAPIWPGQPDIVAVAADTELDCDRPLLDLNDPHGIAVWLLGYCIKQG